MFLHFHHFPDVPADYEGDENDNYEWAKYARNGWCESSFDGIRQYLVHHNIEEKCTWDGDEEWKYDKNNVDMSEESIDVTA